MMWLYYICLVIFSGYVMAPATDVGIREKEYGMEMKKLLVDKIQNIFLKLPELEKSYKAKPIPTKERDISSTVSKKAEELKKILDDRNNMVMRVAEEAERLRNESYPENINSKNVSFYYDSPPVNGTPPDIDPNMKLYRNAKCHCKSQRPKDVSLSRCIQQETEYEAVAHFGTEKVSFLNSSVHIPTEIYHESLEVLKDIYSTDALDETMKREICVENDFSHLNRYIYYSTQSGVMRFFPDRKWSTDCDTQKIEGSPPDLYDSRTAPWFINSVSSSKDVIVLIDASGSIQGLSLNLLHRSIKDLFYTLTTNDFVNVALFNEKIHYIKEGCRGLVQATPRNKQLLQRFTHEISSKGEAHYEEAFSQVLNTLHSTTHGGVHSAECNPVVMFFTDGDSTYPTEAIKEWNREKMSRIFSFAVGKNFYKKFVTKEIACKNRGYYDTIPSFTATKPRVQYYLRKISEPMSTEMKKTPRWTLPYRDQFGVGFVLSVSVPVYRTNPSEENSNQVAGVVGTDLLLNDLKKILYNNDMSKEYYPFVMDNNGFLIIHPYLNESSHDDIMTVDFIELEHKSLENIRKDMIKEISSSVTQSKEIYFDKKYMHLSSYKYQYVPVEGTELKVGLVVHESNLKMLDSYNALLQHYPTLTLNQLTGEIEDVSDSVSYLYSSPCPGSVSTSYNPCEANKTTNQENDDSNYRDGIPLEEFDDSTCNKTSPVYSNLLLHGYLSDDFYLNHWQTVMEILPGHGIMALYIATDVPSFIRIKYLNFTEQSGRVPEKTDEDIKKEIKDILKHPRDSTYMRRAIHKSKWMMYSFMKPSLVEEPLITIPESQTANTITESMETKTIPDGDGETTTNAWHTTEATPVNSMSSGYIVVTKVINVVDGEDKIAPVVAGAVLDPQAFQRNLMRLDWKCNTTENCNKDQWKLLCNDSEITECLILDDGGYLLASNQDRHIDKISEFIGLSDGQLMREMITTNIYKVYHYYDYQARCSSIPTEKSAGLRMAYAPSITDILSLGWWLSSYAQMFIYTTMQHFLLGLWSGFDVAYTNAATQEDTMVPGEMCVLKYPVLNYGANGQDFIFGKYRCSSCERTFQAVRIKSTNLMMIMIDRSEGDASCNEVCSSTDPKTMDPIDVSQDEMCSNKTDRYRKPLENCYDTKDLNETEDSPCSSSLTSKPPSILIILFSILNLFICYKVS